jgi:hypothetical protein
MLPVFFTAADQGRWIALSISSAFIILLESDRELKEKVFKNFRFDPSRMANFMAPQWVAPVGLAFWGFPLIQWSLQKWLWSSPFGTVTFKTYFFLRSSDLLPSPMHLLNGILSGR